MILSLVSGVLNPRPSKFVVIGAVQFTDVTLLGSGPFIVKIMLHLLSDVVPTYKNVQSSFTVLDFPF